MRKKKFCLDDLFKGLILLLIGGILPALSWAISGKLDEKPTATELSLEIKTKPVEQKEEGTQTSKIQEMVLEKYVPEEITFTPEEIWDDEGNFIGEDIPSDKKAIYEIIKKNVPDNFKSSFEKKEHKDFEGFRIYRHDFNKDGKEEFIIIVVDIIPDWKKGILPNEFYLAIANIEPNDSYKKIADFKTEQEFERIIPSIEEFADIDNDGQEEIFIFLAAYGAAGFIKEGILNLNIANRKLDWIKLKDKDDKIVDAIFSIGAIVTYASDFAIKDLDKDGKKEIVSYGFETTMENPKNLSPIQAKEAIPIDEAEEIWQVYYTTVYEWDGAFFSYNEDLSK